MQRVAHLHIGSVEVPEGGEGSREPLGAVTDPQGLEVTRRDSCLLTEALEAIRDKWVSMSLFPGVSGCNGGTPGRGQLGTKAGHMLWHEEWQDLGA